ncbi:MAG: hypothetical protein IJU47_09335 [Verrucomicrobia bacterium]|nr:hypothetical protein [Verrucomicrobiota bacterium]
MKFRSAIIYLISAVLLIYLIGFILPNWLPYRVNKNALYNERRFSTLECGLLCFECDNGYLPKDIHQAVLFVGKETPAPGTDTNRIKPMWLADTDPSETNTVTVYDGKGGFVYDPVARLWGINRKEKREYMTTLPKLLDIPGGRAWNLRESCVRDELLDLNKDEKLTRSIYTNAAGDVIGIDYTFSNKKICNIQYGYNAEGKIIRKVISLQGRTNTVEYSYYPNGAIASESNGNFHWAYQYDERHHLLSENPACQRDSLGNVTNIVRENGDTISLDWVCDESSSVKKAFDSLINELVKTVYRVYQKDEPVSSDKKEKMLVTNQNHFNPPGIDLEKIADNNDRKNVYEKYHQSAYTNAGWINIDSMRKSVRHIIEHMKLTTSDSETKEWSVSEQQEPKLSDDFYYLTDLQGTVIGIVDLNGHIIESYEYNAWGKIIAVYDKNGIESKGSSVGNNRLWQGMEYLADFQLYNFFGCLYDPELGCWLTKSPVRTFFQCHTAEYVFCGNDPVNTVWR